MSKQFSIIYLMLLTFLSSKAQSDNPYKQFGYKPKNQFVFSKSDTFSLSNSDTLSQTAKVSFDFKNKKVFVLSKTGTLLRSFELSEVALYRWISTDPKQSKFPNESPYIFVSNSPLQHTDPDGEEKIVVTGGADLHNKNRMNFVMASKTQLKNYINEVKKAKTGEKVSWVLFDLNYTPSEKKQFEAFAKANGIQTPIYVKSAEEVKNYVNSQNTTANNLSPERQADQVTSISAFSHGVPSVIAFGYENTGYNFDAVDKTDLDMDVAKKFEKGAFAVGANFNIFSCNAATPIDDEQKDFASRKDLIKSSLSQPNLVTTLSESTGATVTGYIGRTNYVPVVNGKLPTPGGTGGDYSPTVNKKSIPSIKVTAQNGTTTTD